MFTLLEFWTVIPTLSNHSDDIQYLSCITIGAWQVFSVIAAWNTNHFIVQHKLHIPSSCKLHGHMHCHLFEVLDILPVICFSHDAVEEHLLCSSIWRGSNTIDLCRVEVDIIHGEATEGHIASSKNTYLLCVRSADNQWRGHESPVSNSDMSRDWHKR